MHLNAYFKASKWLCARIPKIMLVMQLTGILLLGTFLQLSANAFGQKVTISEKKASLHQVFEDIRKQTDYNFIYSNKTIEQLSPINIDIKNADIREVLNICFADQPLTYVIQDKIIIVKRKPETAIVNSEPAHEITGEVIDSVTGKPLTGVTIRVKNGNAGTVSDADGHFKLQIEEDEVLSVSYLGYQPREIAVNGRTTISITLVPAATDLNQLVVVGYGVQKKKDLTGSVSSIDGDNVNRQAVANPVQTLTGLAAGVQTLQNSGAPGSSLSVIVRGDNSLLGGNEPLYVVDGFPYAGSLNNLNPNDIKSIEVLKDASATAIYGSRGANGVVMITTKKGQAGKTVIEYDGYYGWQKVTKKLNLLNAKEFATLANVRAANDQLAPYFTQDQINAFGEGTDWQDEIFRIAPIQNHSLSISGGNENTLFNLSGNYVSQQGIIIGSKYNQGELKVDLSHKINRNWKIDFNGIFTRAINNALNSDNQERGLGVMSGALVAPPTLPVKNEDGTYSNLRIYPFSPDILENPVAMALTTRHASRNNAVLSNLVLNGNITPNLVFHTSVGLQYNVSRGDDYSPTIFQQSANGTASISYSEGTHLVNENLLTYTKQIDKNNNLVLLGGLTSESTVSQGDVASSKGFSNDILENNSLQSGSIPGTPTSSYSKYTILSWLGRANYSYKDRYLLTASVRADGSSRFGASNKWGYFPSVAAAWRISEEKFWAGMLNAISEFKVRGSWGETGNTAVSPYQSLPILSSMSTVFDDNLYVGFAPGTTKPNPNLKWETTSQWNAGADIILIKDRLSLTFDYYHKVTRDLLASIPLPLSSGYSSQAGNIGTIENKGFEMAVKAHIIDHGKFKWDLGGTLTINRNKVISLADGADIFGSTLGNNLPAMSLVRVGQPIGVFFGYVEDGLTDEGNIKYKDLDGDGAITTSDRKVIGNPNPKYIMGLNTDLSYGNFELSVIVNGIQGNDVLAYNLSSIANGFYFGENQLKDVLNNYWTESNPNPHAKYPKVSSSTRYLGSDRYIKDGSYIRIQNIQLSYTLKSTPLNKVGISWAQVYLGAQNLFTFTQYPLYSPDINTRGAGISKGIDEMGYPDTKTVLVGLRLNF